jgi:hypothetical protein
MRNTVKFFAFAVVLLLGVPLAQAQVTTFSAALSGANENPPVVTGGTGTATVTIDLGAQTMRVQANFSGLGSNTTMAHIHCCAVPPANVGVATMTPSFAGFPLGVTSGTMDTTFDLTQTATYNATFVTNNGGTAAGAQAALLAGIAQGLAYFNIHTVNNGGGEIRGTLLAVVVAAPAVQVPAISTWALGVLALVLAAAGWVFVRRRRT